jgi:hypothetical protein
MKSSEHFKRTIQAYLEQRAANDELFAVSYRKPQKNVDDCITYILNMIQKSGCNGFEDSEIYSMATHFYDEDNINIGNPVNCNVVINHAIELTAEEREQAHKDAVRQLQNEYYTAMKQPQKKAKQTEIVNQPSLFDL